MSGLARQRHIRDLLHAFPFSPHSLVQGSSYAERLTATQKTPNVIPGMTFYSLCCHLLKKQRGDTRMPGFCLPPQLQRPFPCFSQARRGHKPLGSSWYLGNRPWSTGDPELAAHAAVVQMRPWLAGCQDSSSACSSSSPTAANKHPGPPSPDARDGRWGKSSEGSRARLQLCLPCLGWGCSCGITAFTLPGPQLFLHGDMYQLRLCCCPAGRSPAPIPDGDALQQVLRPRQLTPLAVPPFSS